MTTLLPLITFVVGLIAGVVIYHFIKGKRESENVAETVKQELNAMIPQITQAAGEQTALLAKEKLEATSKNMKDDAQNQTKIIEDAVKRLHEELKAADAKLEKAERERIGSYGKLSQELAQQAATTEKLSASTENLKKVLSNNQMRGQFGEQVAENLLKMIGFVKGTDYVMQESIDSGSRPDFTVMLPSGTKVNIDSKFPYQNLQKAVETEDEAQKRQYFKQFEADIRTKVKEVSSRNYINPEDNTVDFVILFVPNEMIFSYIYDKMNDVWQDAMEKKVIFVGPFSFTAILRMVRQAYDNFQIQGNIKGIIGQIKVFYEEFQKYNEEFVKFGDRIDSLSKQYQVVSQTRTNKLVRTVEKIQLESGDEQKTLIE